ncbi:hypothetical protein [Mycolicibacterium sp. 018/SC-01/001]|uniref:hypothetical protein n=1 Tax=Mycolicibacterium sp. 018/SC-01/001 TaxID=2592069 RepID=UPI001C8F9865|nr:hypothetical protein [Mycolicibacterium sp. 018/SC-01/001]
MPTWQQDVPLAILGDTGTRRFVSVVAFENEHRRGVIGEHTCSQQSSDTAAEHTGSIEQPLGVCGHPGADDAIEYDPAGVKKAVHLRCHPRLVEEGGAVGLTEPHAGATVIDTEGDA